jgi:WXG100 family type VII secretion target
MGFSLTPEALAAARADVVRAHDTLAAAIGDVHAEVTSVAGASWRGAAAAAFAAGYEEWRVGAAQVLAALASSALALEATRVGYVEADSAASDAFGRLAARLDAAA